MNKKLLKTEEREEFLKKVGESNARKLRSNATVYELDLLQKLKQLPYNLKFQYPIVCECKYLYILDFYFPDLQVVIELHSKKHHTAKIDVKKDNKRKKRLKKEGIEMLILWNTQISSLTSETLSQIMKIAESIKPKDVKNQ